MRTRLLKAAVDELNEINGAALLRGIGVRTIAKRAATSPTTFFREFGTVEAFAVALLDWVYSTDRPGWSDVGATAAHVRRSSLPAEQAQQFHHLEFLRLYRDPEQRLRNTLWAYTGEEGAAAYARFLRHVNDSYAPHVDATFGRWGHELLPPISPDIYVAVHNSLAASLVTRARIEPDLIGPEMFSLIGVAVSSALLRVKGETHSLPTRLTEMNYYPLEAKAQRPVNTQARASRSLILDAASDLFHSYGYDHVTVGQIARRAGVSVSTLYAYFTGKSQLAAALFRAQAADVIETYPEPAADLTEHLTRVAHLTSLRHHHAAHYLAELAVPSQRTEPDALVDAANTLLDDPHQAELAVLLTVRKVLADPNADPAVTARVISQVIARTVR